MASQSSESDIRILLIGRTGHGKSSTGNTIVGKDIFEVSNKSKSKTKTCKWSNKCQRFGKVVEVVDTPGIFDTEMDHAAVHKELLRSLALSTPGFHLIAFVLMKGRFTEEIQKTQDLFFQWFGQNVEKYACIILTDTNSEDEKQEFIFDDPHEELVQLVQTCNNNVVPLNNKASTEVKEFQVKKLFDVAEEIKQKNGNQHFSNIAFQLAESYINSKCPKELTNDSVHLLQKVALSMTFSENSCTYLDHVLNLFVKPDSESTDSEQQESNSGKGACVVVINEKSEVSAKGSVGNLQIFDNQSEERILNKVARKTNMRSPSNETGDSDCLLDSSDSPDFEVSGKFDDRSKKVSRDFVHVQLYDDQDDDQDMQASASDQSDQQYQTGSNRTSTRRGRKVDIDSVHYDTPVAPVDDFKSRVNNCDNADEEVHGLAEYFKKAWRLCKEKFQKCTLL